MVVDTFWKEILVMVAGPIGYGSLLLCYIIYKWLLQDHLPKWVEVLPIVAVIILYIIVGMVE